MQNRKKIIIGSLIGILILILGASLYSYYALVRSLPDYNAEIYTDDVTAETKVYRDSYGIPYIFAENDLDAAFAIGYIHAQERLFQMDLYRRAGEGRLSEIFGSKTLPFDKMFRTVGMYDIAKRDYKNLAPLSKQILEAYSKGVNKFIAEAKGNYQIEFDVLGYDPYMWQPEHSLVIAKLMAWELNVSFWTDVAFTHLAQKFGTEKVKEIIPNFPENAPTIIPDNIQKFSQVSSGFIDTDKKFREFIGFIGTHIGSNNWVVNNKLSVSGKPLIANDTHLVYQAPGKWYVMVINYPSWNVTGFSLPGLPAIVIGKNENIAWAVTNVMTDDSDFYIEKLDSSKTKYFVDGKWRDLIVAVDTIRVKDSADVAVEIRKTFRGPIISDVHPYNTLYPNKEQTKEFISIRWTGYEFSDELFAMLSINKSKNWNDFNEAVKYYTVPGQNFVYGDAAGNIGYICGVRLPIRQNNSISFVYDGTVSTSDWKGFVPYNEMPKLFNPAENYIASANNKTVSSFGYHITNTWEPSARIKRIRELLSSTTKFTVKDFRNIQMDQVSKYAAGISGYITNAFAKYKIEDKNLKSALALFDNWDYSMNKNSQVPTVYAFFLQNLLENIFLDEMGEELFNEYIFVANVPYRIIEELFEKPESEWFDNINTKEIEQRDDIIRKSLVDALEELEERLGEDITGWQWGKMHKVTFKHVFHGVSSLVDELVDIGPFEIGGDGTTVFNTEYSFTEPFDNKLGPSMRYIYDFDNPNDFYFVLPAGQSGYFMSEHYDNMTKMWLKGDYIKIKTDSIYKTLNNLDKIIFTPNQ